jgi:hypothetical protein
MKVLLISVAVVSIAIYAASGMIFAQSLNDSLFWDIHPTVAASVWLLFSIAVSGCVYYILRGWDVHRSVVIAFWSVSAITVIAGLFLMFFVQYGSIR